MPGLSASGKAHRNPATYHFACLAAAIGCVSGWCVTFRDCCNPKSIALFGGGWAANVIAQLKKSGFDGDIWPVHPKRDEILGFPCFTSIEDLPSAPDAAFIGVNREATISVVKQLGADGSRGCDLFRLGFSGKRSGDTGGAIYRLRLVEAAGDMPILGPNCYGFLNYLDNVTFWPDQHGGQSCDRGVGIIAQSSNIAINMTMQRRGLPIGLVVAAGNQAQTSVSDIAMTMLADDRITVIGLYLEGLGDLRQLGAVHGKGEGGRQAGCGSQDGKER